MQDDLSPLDLKRKKEANDFMKAAHEMKREPRFIEGGLHMINLEGEFTLVERKKIKDYNNGAEFAELKEKYVKADYQGREIGTEEEDKNEEADTENGGQNKPKTYATVARNRWRGSRGRNNWHNSWGPKKGHPTKWKNKSGMLYNNQPLLQIEANNTTGTRNVKTTQGSNKERKNLPSSSGSTNLHTCNLEHTVNTTQPASEPLETSSEKRAREITGLESFLDEEEERILGSNS